MVRIVILPKMRSMVLFTVGHPEVVVLWCRPHVDELHHSADFRLGV